MTPPMTGWLALAIEVIVDGMPLSRDA